MSQNEKTVTNEAKQRRSPISPIIPIDDAIEKVRQVYVKDKRAFTDFKTLADHIGYKVKNKGGTAGRAVSALKQYGLLEERAGQYRISEAAWKILEMEEGSEERTRLIKEAALRPPMIRKVFSINDGELPSDATLRNYLLFTEGFNTDTAANFIRVLRRTKELVNPLPEDYNSGEESEGASSPPSGGSPVPSQQSPQRPTGMLSAEAQREILKGSAYGAMHTLLSQTPATSEGLNFQVSENSINVSFNGTVTQELIRKLIKHLEINIEDFPTKAELQRPKRPEPMPRIQASPEGLEELLKEE